MPDFSLPADCAGKSCPRPHHGRQWQPRPPGALLPAVGHLKGRGRLSHMWCRSCRQPHGLQQPGVLRSGAGVPGRKRAGPGAQGGCLQARTPSLRGRQTTSRVRTRKAQAVLVGLVWRCGLLAQAMPLGACGFLFNKSKVIAPLSPLWSQPLVSRAVQAAPRAHTPQAGASSQLSPPAASRPLQLHGSWKPWLRYRLCSPCDGLGVAAGAPSWSWMSIRFPAVPRHRPPPSPPNCPCRSEADSSRGPLPS